MIYLESQSQREAKYRKILNEAYEELSKSRSKKTWKFVNGDLEIGKTLNKFDVSQPRKQESLEWTEDPRKPIYKHLQYLANKSKRESLCGSLALPLALELN